MKLSNEQMWERFKEFYHEFPSIELALDLSHTRIDSAFIQRMPPALQTAFDSMDQLERGLIANPDENRMVGHYWLRNSALAPTPDIRKEIQETIASIKSFAHQIHSAAIQGEGGSFQNLLV